MKAKFNVKVAAFLFLAFAIIIADAHAIGISPSRTMFNFTSGMAKNMSFIVINNENKTLGVQLFVRGDLAQYVQLPENTTAIIPPLSKQGFVYSFKLPSWLEGPKVYDTRIGAVEALTSEGMVGAVAGVEAQLWIYTVETPKPDIVEGELPPIETSLPPPVVITPPSPTGQSGNTSAETVKLSPQILGFIFISVGAIIGLAAIKVYHDLKKIKKRQR